MKEGIEEWRLQASYSASCCCVRWAQVPTNLFESEVEHEAPWTDSPREYYVQWEWDAIDAGESHEVAWLPGDNVQPLSDSESDEVCPEPKAKREAKPKAKPKAEAMTRRRWRAGVLDLGYVTNLVWKPQEECPADSTKNVKP